MKISDVAKLTGVTVRTLHDEEHSRFLELESLIQKKNDTKEILTNFITKLEDLTGEQTEFREELWAALLIRQIRCRLSEKKKKSRLV